MFPRQHLPNSNSPWHPIIANRERRWRNLENTTPLTTDEVKNKYKNTNSSRLDRIGEISKTSTCFTTQGLDDSPSPPLALCEAFPREVCVGVWVRRSVTSLSELLKAQTAR